MSEIVDFSEITPEIRALAEKSERSCIIDQELYTKYDVKRGLRDINGKGVLAGLTEIAEIKSYNIIDGQQIPCEGHLYYRGIDIYNLVSGFMSEKRFGFEEVSYLLLFGKLPTQEEISEYSDILCRYRSLPRNFVRDVILKAPSHDMMNTLSRGVLTLYSYDDKADDTSIPNVLRQCLQLIAIMPMLSVYGYQAFQHYHKDKSLIIHPPLKELSHAQNLLHILRPDSNYTELEAKLLDLALVLHMDHGGGNNSAFTAHVVSSTATDVYSVIAASLGSLKGPRHGGANIKVVKMIDDLKNHITDWEDDEAIYRYLHKLLNKQAFDNSGLIYGIGHAVYSLSDPRANIFKDYVEKLSEAKGRTDEFRLYSKVEYLAKKIIMDERKIYKGVSANIDFYSGFVYNMLDLPTELYTPIFAVARIAGWSAHIIEEIANNGKIIRPAYKSVAPLSDYIPIKERN